MNEYKRSPIFYMGSKYKLLNQLLPLFPKECNTFVDAFGGSGVVSMNYHGKNKTIYNETDKNVVGLIKMVLSFDLEELNNYFLDKIEKYNLRKMSSKNPKLNEEGYLKLRKEYNQSDKKDYKDLFLLMCYSINHLLRFNKNGKYNVGNGYNAYNEKNYKYLKDMQDSFKNVIILNKNVFDLKLDELTKEDFVYFDPPYSNTMAVYNQKGAYAGWSIEQDMKLFSLLETMHKKGIKWGLSNVFENRGLNNEHLVNWCKENNWQVYHLNIKYSPFSKGNSNSDEVYICNYKGQILKQERVTNAN